MHGYTQCYAGFSNQCSVVCLCVSVLSTTASSAKQLNWLRRRLGGRLVWIQGFRLRRGRTWAPPGKYDLTICAVAAMRAGVSLAILVKQLATVMVATARIASSYSPVVAHMHFHVTGYILWTEKTWQYTWLHNSGKTHSMFIIFALL